MHPQRQRLWPPPFPAFPDDDDAQPHCIDASTPALAGMLFCLSIFFFFLFSTLVLPDDDNEDSGPPSPSIS